MPPNEDDLEQLDAYLDDALEPGEVETLRARLATDSDLVSSLDQLRAERAMRQAYFAAIEPAEGEIDHLAARIHASLDRRRRFATLLRSTAAIAAATACFLAGILVHATFFAKPNARSDETLKLLIDGPGSRRIADVHEVVLRDDTGTVIAVQRFDSLEQAEAFAKDLLQWQRRAGRVATGQFTLRAGRL
jgi:anti-sigma factor RsiW